MVRTSKKQWHFCAAAYHVTSRGNNRKNIFYDDEDRTKYLSLLKESIQWFECQIHAYCLMDNHVHLLVQVGSIPISDIMHNINFRYARCFNSKYKKVGHLFQGRYAAQIVSSRDYLIRLIRYIHLNPVRAKTTKRYTQEFKESSAKLALLIWLSTQWALLHFDNELLKVRLKYHAYVQEGLEKPIDAELLIEIDALNADDTKELVRKPENLKQDPRENKASFEFIVAFSYQYCQLNSSKLIGPFSTDIYVHCSVSIAWLSKYFKLTIIRSVASYFNKNACGFGRCKNKFEKQNIERLLRLKEGYLSYLENQSLI